MTILINSILFYMRSVDDLDHQFADFRPIDDATLMLIVTSSS